MQDWSMRILLKFVIDCDADAAWRALHSPRAVAELYGPLIDLAPLEPSGLPTSWESGADVPVQLSVAGLVPMGRQLIHVSERVTEDSRGPVRIFRDSGIPLTGPLASLDVWDHQMAVAPAPGDPTKTLWRDRLVIGGPTAPGAVAGAVDHLAVARRAGEGARADVGARSGCGGGGHRRLTDAAGRGIRSPSAASADRRSASHRASLGEGLHRGDARREPRRDDGGDERQHRGRDHDEHDGQPRDRRARRRSATARRRHRDRPEQRLRARPAVDDAEDETA